MANLTLIVISKSTKFDATKVHAQWQKGDIFDVVRTSKLAGHTPAPNRHFVWIHVTGVPATAVQKAKRLLTIHHFDPLFPDPEPEANAPMLSRRRWRDLLDDLPVGIKNRLRDDRQVTVTWAQAKPFIRDHVDARLIEDADFA